MTSYRFVLDELKLKLKIDKTTHEIKKMYKCYSTGDYSYKFCIQKDEKEEILDVGDQYFAGGESTRVFVVELATEKETFIFEVIGKRDDLWSGLFLTLPKFPIKDHPTSLHWVEDGEEYIEVPRRYMFLSDDKVTHVQIRY